MLPGFLIWDRLRLKTTITSITTRDDKNVTRSSNRESRRVEVWKSAPPPQLLFQRASDSFERLWGIIVLLLFLGLD